MKNKRELLRSLLFAGLNVVSFIGLLVVIVHTKLNTASFVLMALAIFLLVVGGWVAGFGALVTLTGMPSNLQDRKFWLGSLVCMGGACVFLFAAWLVFGGV